MQEDAIECEHSGSAAAVVVATRVHGVVGEHLPRPGHYRKFGLVDLH